MKKNNLCIFCYAKGIIALILVLVTVLLSSCGGKVVERLSGKWIAIKTFASGVTLPASEVYKDGFTLEFVSGSKVDFTVNGEKDVAKWSIDGDEITIEAGSEEWKGTLIGDFIEFKNVSNMGVDITFGREGTDAMDPINTLSENEKKLVGTWVSESVVDVMGTETQVEGVEVQDVLKLTFHPDRVLNIVHKGQEVGDTKWVLIENWDAPEDIGNFKIMYEVQEDGKIKADVFTDDTFLYTVTCVQAE